MSQNDPLMANSFRFYGSSISANKADCVAVLKSELVNYYQGCQVSLEEYCGLLES